MVDPTTLLSLAGVLGGGGGDTEVSQSATNTTNLPLSSVLNNQGQSPIDTRQNAQASSGTTSAAGKEPQSFLPSPLSFPSIGTAAAARPAIQNTANPNGTNDGIIYAGIFVVGAGALYMITKGKKKG